MKVGTCEKCAKAEDCLMVQPITFTGICKSFVSYSRMIEIVRKRKAIKFSSKKCTTLTYKPFSILKSI